MVRLVTPMGTTSNTHHVAASRNTAKRPFAFRGEGKGFSLGVEGGRPGRRIVDNDEQNDTDGHKQIFLPAKPQYRGR